MSRADPNSFGSDGRRTGLHEACVCGGDERVVALLLEYGVNPALVAKLKGRTMIALDMARMKNHTEIVRMISPSLRPSSDQFSSTRTVKHNRFLYDL